jgi:predicted ArsR family transcriptional regulator
VNQRERIESLLAEGPATSAELAAETGMRGQHVSAYLSALYRQGRVTRELYQPVARKAGKPAYLYTLVPAP